MPKLTPQEKIAIVQLAMQKKHNETLESKNESIEVIEDVVKHTEGMQTLIVRVDGDVESITGNQGNDGNDAPPVDEDAIVERVFAKVRVPQDGKDVDDDAVVARVTKLIPKPKDGKDADEEKITNELLKRIELPKTPIKGTDYYTDEEVDELVARIKSDTKIEPLSGFEIRDLLTDLEKGERLHIKSLDGLDDFKKSLATEQKVIGGGTRFLSRLADVDVDGIADGEVLTWDESEGKFVAGTGGAGTIDGSGTANQLTYWVDSDTLGTLAVTTYPSLTEVSYVKGVTSALQTQLNGKEPLKGADDNYVTDAQLVVIGNTSGTNTGDQTLGSFSVTSSAAELNILDGATLSTAELNYVDGVTSAIQTQLDAKAPLASPTFTGTVILPKTLEIQDTSADHQYVLAVSELASDRTVTLPLLTGNDEFVFKDFTQTLTNKSIVATQLTGTAYTMAVNNTNGTAAYTLVPYYGMTIATYGGTITWDGTPPSTELSKQYTWSRVGDTVNLNIAVSYSVSGNSNTLVTFTLPSDCPNPVTIAGSGDAADEVIVGCTGYYLNTITTSPPTGLRSWLSRNSANDGYIISVRGASLGAKYATINLTYRAA